MKVNSVAVVVRDEKAAAKWYTEKLDFRLVDEHPHWHTVSPPDSAVLLHLCPDANPEPGNTGVSFAAKNVAALEKNLAKKGVKITSPTKKEDWGTYFMFSDPDGNEFWVFED